MVVIAAHALALLLAGISETSHTDGDAPKESRAATPLRMTPLSGAVSEPFRMTAADGIPINGQIDFPAGAGSERPLPAVVMIAGTEAFDRDVHYGASDTDDDLLFRQLAVRLAERDIASVRYDFRGIHCSQRTMPECEACETSADRRRHFVAHCVDNDVRRTVTWENARGDFLLVYEHARQHPRIDAERVVVLAHSEGSLHVSYLIGQRVIDPAGLVLIGMPAESPKSVVRWQLVSRQAAALIEQIGGPGRSAITNEEIRDWCRSGGITEAMCETYLAPDGSWTIELLAQAMKQREYLMLRQQWLSVDPSMPFAHHLAPYGGVFASFGWWQKWLTDETPVVERLAGYGGRIDVHLGDRDAATPVDRQRPILDAFRDAFGGELNVRVHADHGHALGVHAMLGPMTPEAESAVLDSVFSMLAGENR